VNIHIVLQSKNPETIWNAFRFAIALLRSDHKVKVLLLGKDIQLEKMQERNFDILGVAKEFLMTNGEMYACGTCLERESRPKYPIERELDDLKFELVCRTSDGAESSY